MIWVHHIKITVKQKWYEFTISYKYHKTFSRYKESFDFLSKIIWFLTAKFLNTSQLTPNRSECVVMLKVLFINWQKILNYIYLNPSKLHVLAIFWLLSYSNISFLGERETSRRLDLTATKINFFSFSRTWFWMTWLFSAN